MQMVAPGFAGLIVLGVVVVVVGVAVVLPTISVRLECAMLRVVRIAGVELRAAVVEEMHVRIA